MKIWESTITKYDKAIYSTLNEIAEELKKYFEEKDNKICVLWREDIFGHQFIQNQLNFSDEEIANKAAETIQKEGGKCRMVAGDSGDLSVINTMVN